MKLYLIGLDIDSSSYIRELVNRDRYIKRDPKYLDSQINNFKERINEIEDLKKELKKEKSSNQEEIHNLITFHAPNYQENAYRRTDNQRFSFIKRSIMPELKRWGFNGSLKDVDDLLINFPIPEEG